MHWSQPQLEMNPILTHWSDSVSAEPLSKHIVVTRVVPKIPILNP